MPMKFDRAMQADKKTHTLLAFPHLYVTQVTWSSIFRVRVCTSVRCFLQAIQKAHIILLRLIITAAISAIVQLTYKTKTKQKTHFLVNIIHFDYKLINIYLHLMNAPVCKCVSVKPYICTYLLKLQSTDFILYISILTMHIYI